jgi:uncharacterized membrane protein
MTKLSGEQLMKFFVVMSIFVAIFLAVFSMWQIDVSVGAMNSGGCVFQDDGCVPALVHYEKYLGYLFLSVLFLSGASFALLFSAERAESRPAPSYENSHDPTLEVKKQ